MTKNAKNGRFLESMKFRTSLFMFSLIFLSASFAQEALKSVEEEYYDFLALTGVTKRPTLGYRTLSDSEWQYAASDDGNSLSDSDENIWKENNLGTKRLLWQQESQEENWFTRGIDRSVKLKIYGPEWFNSYNTKVPYGQNDGALWQGKGYNTSLNGGARLEAYGFELTVKPQVSFSENRSFELMPSVNGSEYSYFQSGIDFPQRFGDSSFWTFDWGDTEARYTWNHLTIGFGTQAPWLGPAWLNPMLGSNNAATYPKIDFGLRKTSVYMPHFGWHIGDIEGRIWTGKLTESDYFDANDDNDFRMLNAISLSFAPSFIPGLTLGVNRIFITNWAAHNLKYIGRLFTLSHSNGSQVGTHEDEDQKIALFADWHFPKMGFEIYGEFGKDDFSDSLSNPFHTAIYTVGVKQATPLPFRWLKGEIIVEWNNFEMSQDFQLQWNYTGYYSHGSISQGYTQKGQILGAGSGAMGNSQFIGYKLYYPKGSILLFFHRFCPDNNYIYNKSIGSSDTYGTETYTNYWARYETYKTYGVEAAFFIKKNFYVSTSVTRLFIPNFLYDYSKSKNISGFNFKFTGKYNF